RGCRRNSHAPILSPAHALKRPADSGAPIFGAVLAYRRCRRLCATAGLDGQRHASGAAAADGRPSFPSDTTEFLELLLLASWFSGAGGDVGAGSDRQRPSTSVTPLIVNS